MQTNRRHHRPTYEEALQAFKSLLERAGHSTDILWVFDENLCFEKDEKAPGGAKFGFQTVFTPHPPDAAKVTYHHFAEEDARLVFYRVGSSNGRSICLQLCDPWFESKGPSEGYVRMDEWLISFYAGAKDEVEEVRDERRWQGRAVRGRPLSALDFCMTLAALRELRAHGRVLSPDERFGLKILRSLKRPKPSLVT